MVCLADFAKPLPRYTSYPTAPMWEKVEADTYAARLKTLHSPLSCYIHIPFCERICLFCGCSTILNRKKEIEERYIQAVIQEMALISSHFSEKKELSQLHFGGGSPSKLSSDHLALLLENIRHFFSLLPDAEVAIEVDPRELAKDPAKLTFLRALGFNRLSFGVQDTNPKVQEAILRRQSLEMTRRAVDLAKEAHFQEINLDLIYGLPFQTKESFDTTIQDILALQPERVALYSFAYLPELKPHQRAIKRQTLPSIEEKLAIFTSAQEAFIRAGYLAIGMDHFAKKGSELARGYIEKTLHRNFQGYTVKRAESLLGLGLTAISDFGNCFFQNSKDLKEYYEALDSKKLATERGKILTTDDLQRRFVIQSLMCRFDVDKREFFSRFGLDFDRTFAVELKNLNELQKKGLVVDEKERIFATPLGEIFIRHIASCFDSYLQKEPKRAQFSSSI